MTSDYAKGRADALKEAAAVARNWGAQGRAIAQQIEALAQQPHRLDHQVSEYIPSGMMIEPQPKRECGTCLFGDAIRPICAECIRYQNPRRTDKWKPRQPKESA